MAKFKQVPASNRNSESPERLFDDLPRARDGIPSLWAHQADMLREYHTNHLETDDIALELPTGAGKTLPALLIAEWRRSQLDHRVVYACPTVQLANQVYREARRLGIEAVSLHGSHYNWENADLAEYEGGNAIAVTSYNTLFNSSPKLSPPRTLLFDDVHTAEGIVASTWSVDIRRFEYQEIYEDLLESIGSELSGVHLQRLLEDDPDPKTKADVKLYPISALRNGADKIDRVLRSTSGDIHFRYTMIRQFLDRCLLLFGWDGILIRPFIPPTNLHDHFTLPEQRIYISATLGYGGELERAFGRSPIARLPVPSGWDQRGSGRRFFVFPELIRDVEPRSIVKAVIAESKKAIVLSPSNSGIEASKSDLIPTNISVFEKDQIETTLDHFRESDEGVLVLANRYDGIDLADHSCRVTVLDSLPTGQHLLERFLVDSLRVGRVLEERLRTRVIQGAGRCTRGLNDYSVVLILGTSLTRFLHRTEIREALLPETQAEIAFGMENSQVSERELREMIQSCLCQDGDWQDLAEPQFARLRQNYSRRMPPGTELLAESVSDEVSAWNMAIGGDFLNASRLASRVADSLSEGSLTPYKSLWLYFAAEWLKVAANIEGDRELHLASDGLLTKAHIVAKSASWLRELVPNKTFELEIDPVDELAASNIAGHKGRKLSAMKWVNRCETMLTGLSGTKSSEYEVALSFLGSLLGAEAFKPEGRGRADAVWVYGEQLWITLEAKSEVKASGLVSLATVKQGNSHLQLLSADRNRDVPSNSVSAIVSPQTSVDPDASTIANPNLYLCSPSDILLLAQDCIDAWNACRHDVFNVDSEEASRLIYGRFAEHQVLPSNVLSRITARPVG